MVALFCMGFNMKTALRNYLIVLAVVYLFLNIKTD